MRVLVYGCGQLASGVVRSLISEATEITVLGNERSQLERLSSFPKVSAVLMEEPIMRDYLMEAHIATADAFLALSADDHENLLGHKLPSGCSMLKLWSATWRNPSCRWSIPTMGLVS